MDTRFPDLSDEALVLRAWSERDVDALVNACSDPELHRRLGVPVPYTSDDASDYIALCATGWATGSQFAFAVVDRVDNTVAGSVRVGPSPISATAGYWTAPWARGRGVASGALRLVTEWAIGIGLSPVRLYVANDNIASQRVALKASYRRDERGAILDPEGVAGDLVFIAP
jgi:RimJ/RimL family protein N-acetyltransferase